MDTKTYNDLMNTTGSAIQSTEAAKAGRAPTTAETVKMREYAKRWRKRNPHANAAHLAKAVMKKFGVQLV